METGIHKKRNGFIMLLTVVLLVLVITTGNYISGLSASLYRWHACRSDFDFNNDCSKKSAEAGMEVYRPLAGKKDEAGLKLSYIVGRDTEKLDESEIVRGTIETVAENTSDGITAPLFWAFIGGAPLAMVYRVINTCDSMVGYKNEKYSDFGWASAKLDDVVNWIPSRITGFLMLLAYRPEKAKIKATWKILFRDAKKHPSPNSGWCEAAAAALLGVQLGGVNTYKGIVSNRALMGDPLYLS